MKVSLVIAWILACVIADAEPPQPRQLTIQEAHSILEAYLPDKTKKLPGYGLDDFAGYDPEKFYFIEVTWDNPGGSVVWGNYAVDKATGDSWSAVASCDKITSRRVRAVQRKIRQRIGLTDALYKQIKNSGPLCEISN
jgi:hypothetical protein